MSHLKWQQKHFRLEGVSSSSSSSKNEAKPNHHTSWERTYSGSPIYYYYYLFTMSCLVAINAIRTPRSVRCPGVVDDWRIRIFYFRPIGTANRVWLGWDCAVPIAPDPPVVRRHTIHCVSHLTHMTARSRDQKQSGGANW